MSAGGTPVGGAASSRPESVLPYGISTLLNARSLAVIGASDRPGSIGGTVLDHLAASGFAGTVHPVHPRAETVRGITAHPRVTEVPDTVDLAMLVIPADAVESAVTDCTAAGVAAVIVTSSGFADAGNPAVQDRIAEQCADAGMRLLGPNCIGAANIHTGLIASFSPMFTGYDLSRAGGVGVVSHSGGVGFGITSLAAERGLRPGWVVTTGNEADITAGEMMWAMASMPDCTGVMAYLESVPDESWLARLADTGTPVAAILTGRSPEGAAAAVTRAAAPSPDDQRLLEHYGVAVAPDVPRLLDYAAGFESPTLPGDRIAVVTTSGGAGILAADAVHRSGLRLARLSATSRRRLERLLPEFATVANPLDVTAGVIASPELLVESLRILAEDDQCDGILVSLCVLGAEQADAAAEVIIAAAGDKPVVVSRTGADTLSPTLRPRLSDAGIGVFGTPDAAIATLDAWRSERIRERD
ncbi:acyl-CoA synthetase (NDP forming) [Stackebrandtia endophytica]|uniref:Acyl-CoA synthetase (NDP forming) n=1 Tax=Stackebrandtia endophytica TaxID=1496996 RepID=A0A543AXK5_9ACTN|nr:CoA-binding protein [Stackebrandtia endophytica]TQL77280.1 acyl-CoA synthetase (NDP forming) [Stackebrandtia endophytica]